MSKMRCTKCSTGLTRVIDSRSNAGEVVRRRECLECSHRFNTRETTLAAPPVASPDPVNQTVIDHLRKALLLAMDGKFPLSMARIVFTEEMDEALRSGHRQGTTRAELAKVIGVAEGVVVRRIKELNLPPRKRGPKSKTRLDKAFDILLPDPGPDV